MQRAVQRQQHHAGTQPQFRRDQGDLAQIGDLLDVLERMGAVVRSLGDHVVAEFLGAFGGIEVLLQADPHVVALRILAADDQAEAHHVFSSRCAEGGSAFGAVKVKTLRHAAPVRLNHVSMSWVPAIADNC